MRAKQVIFLFILLILVILLIPTLSPTIFSGFIGFLQPLGVGKEGVLILGGANPQVREVYINTSFCPVPGDSGPRSYLPRDASNIYVNISALIFDINGDCDEATSVTAYLCTADAEPTTHPFCYEGTGDHSDITLYLDGHFDENGNPSDTGLYCNYSVSAPLIDIEYWERWGNWSINVTVFDKDNLANDSVGYWYYAKKISAVYPSPYSDMIFLGGDLFAGSWNEGKGQYKFNNTGNIRINATWNATDFMNYTIPDQIPIVDNGDGTTNFCVDRDLLQSDGCDYINETETIRVESYPTDGIRRCGNFDCSDDEQPGGDNWAFYDIYWHIYIDTGTSAGLYNNTVEYHLTEYRGIGI